MEQDIQALLKTEGPFSTGIMLEAMFRKSAEVPDSVPLGKLVDCIIQERQAANDIINGANPQSERNKSTQDAITTAVNGISQSFAILENDGSKSTFDTKTDLQETYAPLRAEVSDDASKRDTLVSAIDKFMNDRSKLLKRIMERFINNPSAEVMTLVNELQRQQNTFVKQIEALNSKETILARKLQTLNEKCMRTTKALTGIDIQAAQELPRLG